MIVWFAPTGASLLLLSLDLATNSPVSGVQKLAWWLVVLCTGPIGFIAFPLTRRRPLSGGHDRSTRPAWKPGDATGVLIAAARVEGTSVGLGGAMILVSQCVPLPFR